MEGRRNFKRKGRKWELTNFIRGVNIIVHKIYLIYRPPNNFLLSTYPCFFLVPTFSSERFDIRSKIHDSEPTKQHDWIERKEKRES